MRQLPSTVLMISSEQEPQSARKMPMCKPYEWSSLKALDSVSVWWNLMGYCRTVFDVRNDAVYWDDAREIAVSLLVRICRIGFFRLDENMVEIHVQRYEQMKMLQWYKRGAAYNLSAKKIFSGKYLSFCHSLLITIYSLITYSSWQKFYLKYDLSFSVRPR